MPVGILWFKEIKSTSYKYYKYLSWAGFTYLADYCEAAKALLACSFNLLSSS